MRSEGSLVGMEMGGIHKSLDLGSIIILNEIKDLCKTMEVEFQHIVKGIH